MNSQFTQTAGDDAEDMALCLLDIICTGKPSVVIWGMNAVALRLLAILERHHLRHLVRCIVDDAASNVSSIAGTPIVRSDKLADIAIDVLVVTPDQDKEIVLRRAASVISGTPRVLLRGSSHLKFRDAVFDELIREQFVSSHAEGYSNMLVHLYQCLQYIAKRDLSGSIAEFGVYKGGTSAFLARVMRRLGLKGDLYAFDTFGTSPNRHSLLDLYSDPNDLFIDGEAVKHFLKPYGIRIVEGDICDTFRVLHNVPLVLAFFDTDNYSPTHAALGLCYEQLVTGGVLAFDHYFCDDRWLYTVGERLAVEEFLPGKSLFNLHGTGIFVKY